MAKTTAKKAAKKASPKKAAPVKKSSTPSIEATAKLALDKLREHGLDAQLQADLDWCLGSYKFDKNPVGLHDMVGRAIKVFSVEKAKKTKGITAKLLSDLEKGAKK